MTTFYKILLTIVGIFFSFSVLSSGGGEAHPIDLTGHWVGIACVIIFVISYSAVIGEEVLHLKKSIPVLVSAGIIWMLVAWVYGQHGDKLTAEIMVRHNLLEYAELFLFLLAAMTYINTMEERGVFDALLACVAWIQFEENL